MSARAVEGLDEAAFAPAPAQEAERGTSAPAVLVAARLPREHSTHTFAVLSPVAVLLQAAGTAGVPVARAGSDSSALRQETCCVV
jgi:hypothetical protein